MLFVLFQLDGDHYALDAAQVVEVLPLVQVKKVPRAAPGIAGIFTYRGAPVPVLDLSELALGRPAEARLSTRLLLVHYPDGWGRKRLLGLIAEKATETLRREPGDFADAGVNAQGAPFLGPVLSEARGIVQWVQVDRLLSPPVRAALFPSVTEAGA